MWKTFYASIRSGSAVRRSPSIAAVSQVELITKTYSDLTGTRYVIEGSREMSNDEIGAPDGTTFIVRNLFTIRRHGKRFLKTAAIGGKLYQ